MITFREIQLETPEYEVELRLREAVLRTPLGLSFTAEEFAQEPHCFHLGGFDGERLVAVLLLKRVNEHTVKMRQVAVEPGLQGRGVGSQLVECAEAFARARDYTTIIAHARGTAVDFYRRIGYSTSGEPFIETTIPHILVSKEL